MADKKKTWVSILVAGLIIVALSCLVAIGGSMYWVGRHVALEFTSNGECQLEQQRERFAGQQALIELRGDPEAPTIHRRANAGIESPQTLRVLAFDPRTGKLLRVNVPLWLLRLVPSRRITVRDTMHISLDDDRLDLTVQDLDRAGPGLILDARHLPGGTEALVWTE